MKLNKFFGTVFSAVMATSVCLTASITANAASVTNNGLTAEIISDNNYYAAGEIANVVIKVTNNNDFAVSGISAEAIIPEGLELVGETDTITFDDMLEAGETVKLKIQVKSDKEVEPSDEPVSEPEQESSSGEGDESTVSEPESENSSGAGLESTVSEPSKENSSNSTEVKPDKENNTNKDVSAPNTGDTASAIIIIAIMAGVGAVIFVCIKKKKATKIFSLALCAIIIGATVIQIPAAAIDDSVSKDTFSLSEALYFDKDTYNLSAVIKFDKVHTDNDVTYTRGEWIKLLAENTGINVEQIEPETVDWFYGDTDNNENGILYEYAHRCGIIPAPDNEGYVDPEQDIALFEENKIVTREYAAYSAVKALGFFDETPNLDCTDADTITYKSAVTTALKFNMLSLIDGKFEPNQYITQADKNQIIAVIRAFNESVTTDEDETANNITYNDGVISDEIADITDYKAVLNSDDTYTVTLPLNDVTKQFAENTVFVLPKSEDYPDGAPFKVISVTKNDDEVSAICAVPSIEEVAKGVYMKDTVIPSAASFIPEEGVSVEVLDSSDKSGDEAPIDLSEDFDFSNASLKITAPIMDKGEVSVSFSIPKISVAYKSHMEWDWFNSRYVVDEALFAMTQKLYIEGSLKFFERSIDPDSDDGLEIYNMPKENVEQLLGKVPVTLPAGFKIDVKVYLYASVTGELTIGFVSENTSGLQVVNGSVRQISSQKSYFDKLELAGSAEIGVKPSVTLGWTIIDDLIGIQLKAGAGLKASLNAHVDINLYCLDVTEFFALSLGISSETAVGKIVTSLGVSLEWEIFNEDNSPLRLNLHIENLRIVDECTYGNGALEIVVSDSNGDAIKQYQVIVKDASGETLANDFVRNTNKTTVSDIGAGQVTVKIKATGYKVFNSREIITSRSTTHMEAVLMILRSDEDPDPDNPDITGKNNVSGTVTDALTGSNIKASYSVRSGRNAPLTDAVIKSGETDIGTYKMNLPYGYYTITFSKDGYIDSSINVTVRSSSPTTANVTISPELSSEDIDLNADLRIVLTWGLTPADLDSHLLSSANSGYHTYYRNKDHYEDGVLVANLDLDDTTSYGPETTTIYKVSPGEKFSYYVHDFTNRKDGESQEMSYSGARIVVYSGSTAVAAYNVPIGYSGNLWHVFDYDPSTKSIIPVNTFASIGDEEFAEYFINRY
ncbi:MAG: hypothetical protein PUG48_06865 [Clostridia bacterium]|nr:hypothetical protein [Clostridia bacterium]